MIDFKKYKGLIVGTFIAALFALLTVGDIESPKMNGLLIFPVLMIGSLCAFYFISRDFFKKYSTLIALICIFTLAYFIYILAFDISEDGWVFNLIALPVPLFVLLWFFERWRWVKTLEAEKEKAELSLLKSQVNPHFFFNTLNNLHALAVKKSDQAPEVILKLSEIMRYTIYEGEKEQVSLNQEVNYLNNYIDLHKIRYRRIVDIRFTSSIEQKVYIAPILFIVLLENAFKHGVESVAESAFIHMNLTSNDGTIEFTIENNFALDADSTNKGIGMENLKKRLNLIYPNNHELRIVKTKDVFKVCLKIDTK